MTDTGTTDEPAAGEASGEAPKGDDATETTASFRGARAASAQFATSYGALAAARQIDWDKLSAASRLAEKVAKSGVPSQLTAASPYANIVPKMDWGQITGASAIADMIAKSGPFAKFPALTTALSGSVMPKLDVFQTGSIGALLRQINALDLEDLRRHFRPRNLRARELDSAGIATLMEEEGLPFCLVPDAETAQMLLEAEDRPARRRVLVSRAGTIFGVCDDVVALCVDQGLPEQGALIRKAIRAYGDGHPEAAQALATVVLDRLVGQYRHQGQIKNPVAGVAFIQKLPWREWFFLMPMPVVHDKIVRIVDLTLFNRNVTVHKVQSTQMTASNAVQAIMLATSMLGFHQDLW